MTSKIKVDNIADQDDNNIINESGDVITVGAAGDTVAVAGNIVKSNALQASDGGNIVNQSGTTITLGASGDTIALASGASQTGFGRTGTVDWQTGSIKTATFTADNGEGYFCNTSGGSFTVNLPAGSAGAIVSIADYGDNFNTNALTVAPNGSEKISGEAQSVVLETQGQSVTLVFVDSTEGWVTVNDSSENVKGDAFIAATGGTITDCGNCRIHTFTSPGTFTVSKVACSSANNQVSYLVIGGGGGGGGGEGGGGGGAGGFREDKSPVTPYCASPLEGAGPITVTATAFPITVGAGGTTGSNSTGGPSVFSTITSTGGGNGGGAHNDGGNNGGSGGGGTGRSGASGGSGNTPPVSPSQGNNAGTATPAPNNPDRGGGGGGASAAGTNANGSSGAGGAGVATSITGSAVTRAGGGGGGKDDNQPNGGVSGDGGAGGGGRGASSDGSPRTAEAGEANTGGGGGGIARSGAGRCGQNGGSGIVVIRYKKR